MQYTCLTISLDSTSPNFFTKKYGKEYGACTLRSQTLSPIKEGPITGWNVADEQQGFLYCFCITLDYKKTPTPTIDFPRTVNNYSVACFLKMTRQYILKLWNLGKWQNRQTACTYKLCWHSSATHQLRIAYSFPANTIHWANAGLMLAQRRRRWANIKPALAQCIVLSGLVSSGVEEFRWYSNQSGNK